MLSKKLFRIGTRDSKLALWQANLVQQLLESKGHKCTLVPVKSEGDLDLVTPLYAMGVQGVFTKTLDAYLLSNKIDIAVHSMKDVPTQLANGIAQAAVLKRGNYADLLVFKNESSKALFTSEDQSIQQNLQGIVATGSVRRKAQLLHRFPRLQIENLRGNVQTRLQKLQDNQWEAAVFAAAGLERIEERPALAIELEWMLPAPAQGAIMIACRENDEQSLNACYEGNDAPTEHCVRIEREFLSTLMGGCSTPISALAKLQEGTIHFRGSILSLDGKVQFDIELQEELSQARNLGRTAAEQLLNQGAKQLVEEIRNLGK